MASSIPFISWAQDPQIPGDLREKTSDFQNKITVFEHCSVLLFWMTGRD